jgi:hypothetical protein
MQTITIDVKRRFDMKRAASFLGLFLFTVAIAIVPLTGCSTGKTTVTKTEYREEPAHRNADGDYDSGRVAQSKTVEVEKERENNGIFGILGDIIALPFRAVGALFGAIV